MNGFMGLAAAHGAAFGKATWLKAAADGAAVGGATRLTAEADWTVIAGATRLTAVASRAAVSGTTRLATTAGGTGLLATTAADRLFDDFVILAFVGIAIAIALYIISAFRKLVRGLE